MSNRRKVLGYTQLAEWLYNAGWTQESIAKNLCISRMRVKTVLNTPEKHLTIRDIMLLNMMLPEKSFGDIINSITRAPITTNLYLDDELLIPPTQKKKQWFDED
jgi:hypothetical protein